MDNHSHNYNTRSYNTSTQFFDRRDSNRCVNLVFDQRSRTPAKECFKVIYGLGSQADRIRLLQSETKAERKRREELEREEERRKAYETKVFRDLVETSSRSSASSRKA